MTNFYFNLTKKLQGCSKQKGMVVCTSNPDGQPTVNRQSAMTLLSGKKAEKEQLSSTCLRSASDLPPFRSRYLRYAAMIFAVLVMSIANIGMAWGADISNYATGLENGTTGMNKGECGSIAVSTDAPRTGSKCISTVYTGGTGNKRWYPDVTFAVPKNSYFHVIAYAKLLSTDATTESSSTQAYADAHVGTAKAGTAVDLTTSWKRITSTSGKASSDKTGAVARLYRKHAAKKEVLFDDVVAYVSTNSSVDLVKPSSATSASATTSSISWTCGTDANTGIQNTLIFHRTGGSVGGNDLTLNDQGIYSLTATEGPSTDQSGNWTLLSASVGATATSYSGTFTAGHEYAIVHRDLAYNYSTPTYVTVAAGGGCVAPSSVGISGEWRYFPGQTISLMATPTGHTGTPTYQWQKEISADNWQNISNGTEAGVTISGATTNNLQITPCGTGNTGKYRCSVSTGATCSTTSDPFSVKIFTLNGAYDDGEFTSNNITFTSGTTGTATVHLAAGRVYKFKVTDNFGMWFGNSGRILEPAVNWTFPSNNSTNCVLFTGPEGDYTFTVDIDHVTYGTPEVVVSVAYPDVTHPSAGYAYFKNVDNWTKVGLYMWYEGGGSYTDWGSEPWVTRTTTICGNTYYYTPLIPSWYNRAIFREVGGSGQTGNIEYANLAAYSGKYNDKSDANWHEFTTYTISFAGNGNTGGSMSAIAGICPNSSQEITANAFEKTGYTFNCWHADKAVKVGGSTIAIGGDIAGGATLQEINNNITLTAQWSPEQYDVTLEKGSAPAAGSSGSAKVYYDAAALTNISHATWAGHVLTGYYTSNSGGTKVLNADGSFAAANVSDYITDNKWTRAENTTVKAQWTAKTTTITINANTANHGSTAPSPITATYGSALPSFSAATGASGWTLTGYFTAATDGTKIINADGTLVASTDYADGSGNWKYETATLTLYAQYEEETPAPAGDCGEIIKSTFGGAKNTSSTPSTTTFNTTGEIGGTSTSAIIGDNGKLNSEGAYLILKLSTGTFLAGDTIKISSDKSGGVKFATGTVSTQTYTLIGTASTATSGGQPYYFVLAANADSIIIPRGASGSDYEQNPKISYVSVHRPCPECDATPSAPTATSNGATAATTQVVSWTDGSNDKWDVYVSTSSSTPAAGDTPTASGLTAKTYTFTGLTASTAYYWWVRSVCDDTHKSSWFAGSSFTTSAAPAGLTAIEENTLYQPLNMLCTGMSPLPSSDTYFTDDAYSTDNRFYYDVSSGNGPKAHTISSVTLGSGQAYEATFTSEMWVKGTSTVTDGIPSAPSIKFLTPSTSGTLYLYIESSSCPVKFKKEDGTASNITGLTQVVSGKIYSTTVEANSVYYIYGNGGSNTGVYGLKLITCSTPAAPTAFAAGSITSTGATFTITDAGDAASYDIYYSTSSTAPNASTPATTTSTSKTKAVTGLTASTTYYAWVRSVCDASHKSDWVALGTTSFTTSAAEPTALVTWQMKVDQAAWALKSGTTEDGTNITSIASTADEPGSTSTGITGTTGKVVMASGESNVDKAASFTFTVNSAKKVVPEKVTCKVLNVSSGNRTYKAQLSDNNGHVYYSTNTVSVTTENVLTDATFNFASSLVLTGNVTLKVYAWKTSGSPTQFRMGEYVKLFGEVQNAADYTVTHTMSNVTKSAGETSVKEGNSYTATYAGAGGYALPSTITVTIGGSPATAGTDYTWMQGTGVVTIPGNKVTGNIVITVTGVAPAPTYSVTHSLTNVTATSGATGAGAATEGIAYNAVFAANTGFVLPSTITVTIGGSSATAGTGYTWNASTGAFQVPAAQVTGAIVITIAGETAPATKDIYYGHVKITDGALVREIPSGATQFFTNIGGTVANTTEISLSSTPSTTGMYYNSNNLTDTELSKSSNWGTSSGSNRYVRGLKFANGATYTLALGTKVASTITFYGWCGSSSKTMTVGDEEFTSSSTKNTFAKHEFIKTGGFTGDVSITQDGDFYGILVITIQTATPCTTPVIPTLSNQSLCVGADIEAWDATQTAVLADGETVAYSWKKKGNATELANTASFDLGASAAESQAGTYVVTVTVSKAGKASATATKEVTLTVNEATEVTAITADKATVYPTNSVTLTATANMDATWQWYLCANADGTGAGSSLGTSSSYTIASAGAAGTYYYKAVATGSCGTDEMVYTLTVSAAAGGDCFHYVSVLPDKDISPSSGASIVTPTHATTLEGGTMKVGSQQITITKNGLKLESSKSVSITLDNALEAGNVVIVKGTAATAGYGVTINGVNFYESGSKTFDVSYTVLADDGLVGKTSLNVTKYSGSSYLQEIKITGCGASCTDPEVTASADNTTACVGTSVTFTATGAHASATYQWQKLDGTWTNISGATESTYNIPSVVAGDAGKYRVIARHDCNRTSNEVTLSVPPVPNFGSTVPASVSVMQTIALSINTVEATDAVKYKWYKSADATWDAGDTEIGTNKELIKAYDSEAIGSPSYYIFCRAQNACGITTSTAIAVNVTAYVEEDCATRGNESDAAFSFENSGAGQGDYGGAKCWTMSSNSKILVYYPPTGKYFKTAKVTIASSSESKASYNWSTNGGTSFTAVSLTVNSTLTERTIDLSTHGNVDAFQIGRNFGSKGSSGGTLYVSKICFEYTDACTATTVTPSPTSKTYEMDGSSFTEPTFTVKHGETAFDPQPTLSYSSSNEDIASVDDDGTVTFNGEAGTVTITASYAGGTISATDYCASSGSYTINVSCPGGAPKVVASGSVDMSGCNSSVTLLAKTQVDGYFADGTYQWFRNGEEIDGATSSSYTATQAGTYTVARTNTSGCTTPSTNSAIVTSETTEPEVERLVPFQYYHVDKTYTDQMKMRHLFAVKNSGTLDGKHFKMYVSRNGGAATDVTSSNALVVVPNGDGHVDTVMVDLNKLSGKYSENDELVFTCKAIDCSKNISDVYKNTITMNVIGATPTLALICSGTDKAAGTRKTSELTVGGDFLTGYNKADLCEQTGNTSFDANTEWGLYTRLKENYIVTPVNGYAVFNKLNYEPFDILLLTDYPKASKSDAAATVLDDMADLCDYRPMLSFKAHMVAKSPSKWAAKGFTTSPVVPKNTRTRLNIVCYAHPMFADMKTTATHIQKDNDDPTQIVYTMLEGAGYEGSKGLQGFELEAAENFVTIGLVHYNASPADATPSAGLVTWTPGSEDRMLVTAVERQENIEARMIMFAVNCGAQSKFTETGRNVVLKCLEYLLDDDPLHVADCSFTFDNGVGNSMNAAEQAEACESCTGTKGDGKWSTAANWGPDYVVRPGKDTEVKIAAHVTVDPAVGAGAATNFTPKVRSVRILEGGQVEIPAGSYLEVVSTIRRQDGNDIYPTEANDIVIGSSAEGNGTLIFNNNAGDTKARVDMYSTALADVANMSAATSTWQYIGTPHNDVASATRNYYDSWLYQYDTESQGWTVIKNGGPLVPFHGYCVTHPAAPVVFDMEGTLVATTSYDISVPANKYVVAANSWVAPIDIDAITNDDMENISDKAIYFFNTGSDSERTGAVTENATGDARWAAGTYVTIPIHSAPYTGTDDHIPSMQGFYVWSTTPGTLHLDYDRHVRGTSRTNKISGRMHAPKRVQAEDNAPEVLWLVARGNHYDDRLVVLEREDFTRNYESGWDGEAWGGSDLSPMVYITNEAGVDEAVSAIPEFEGTVITFRAGEDSEYRFEFTYSEEAEPLYLLDTDNNTYTQVVTGNEYYFTTYDKSPHKRFVLTRKAPQIATGTELTSDGEGANAKKLLIEDKMYILLNGMLYDATGKIVK